MRNLFIKRMPIFVLIAALLFFTPVNAAVDTTLQNDSAQALVKLGILQGYADGNLGLKNNIKRSEFFTLVIRLLGYDKDTDLANVKMNFKDINSKHWAYNYIKIAYKHGIVSGYQNNTVAPDNTVTYGEALTVLVKALGYGSTIATGKWPDNVISESAKLGLSKNVDLTPNKPLTRGEMSVIVYNALTINLGN